MVTRPRRGDQVAPTGPRLDARSGCSTRPSACRAKRPGIAWVHRVVGRPRPSTEARAAVVGEGLLDARLVVHHERPVLRDRLTDRPALQHEHLCSRRPTGDREGLVGAHDGADRAPELVVADDQRPFEDVDRADGVGAFGGREAPLRAGIEHHVPDGQVGLGSGGPRARRGGQRLEPGQRTGDDGHLGRAAFTVLDDVARQVFVPEHREVGLDHLVGGREVEPDLEQLARVGPVLVEEREHLAVDDAPPGGEPLHVAPAEASGGTEGVGVVDVALPGEGHRLEAPVGVLGEPRDRAAVVHAPAVGAREVHADVAGLQRGCRAHVLVGRGVVVEVVDAEEERVGGGPLEAEGDGLQHWVGHEGEATPGRCAGTGPTAGRAGRASG